MKRRTKFLSIVLACALSLSVGVVAASAHGGRHGGHHGGGRSSAYCGAAQCPGTHGGYGHHGGQGQCHEALGESCPQDCPLHRTLAD